jgi:putative N6-adenine-specific DNA methylase
MFTRRELISLGVVSAVARPDGVAFSATASVLYAANLWLRTASRVVIRVAQFHASEFHELQRRAGRIPWERFVAPSSTVHVRAACHKSRLYHSDAVAERISQAAGRAGAGAAVAGAPASTQLIVARLVRDVCTISLDASGELLHRRGYRQATAKAPLRETLAAALLLASGWDGAAPLVDPMCGAGTIAIEAALIAAHRAPGLGRGFAFERWPEFDSAAWKGVLDAAHEQQVALGAGRIYASDRDPGATAATAANAARAGVAGAIEITTRALSAIEPPAGPGWLITNPPYGIRTGERDRLRNLYAQLGNVARARCPGWSVALLAADRALAGHTGLALSTRVRTTNGGIPVEILAGTVPRASAA